MCLPFLSKQDCQCDGVGPGQQSSSFVPTIKPNLFPSLLQIKGPLITGTPLRVSPAASLTNSTFADIRMSLPCVSGNRGAVGNGSSEILFLFCSISSSLRAPGSSARGCCGGFSRTRQRTALKIESNLSDEKERGADGGSKRSGDLNISINRSQHDDVNQEANSKK